MFIISLLSPALSLLIILGLCFKNWKNNVTKDIKRLTVPLGMIFGTMGYCFRFFAETNDLSRYFIQVNSISGQSFGEIIASDSEMLYLRDGLFYFVNKCGNQYILPFIVGFLIYSISFYVLFDMICRSKRQYRYSEVFLLSIIMVGILAPLIVIGNTRCVLSFILITFAIYRDIIQQKHNLITLLLYVAPIGLHSSAIVIIMIRLMSIVFKKYEKAKWVILSIVLFLPTIIDFFYEHVAGLLSGPVGSILVNAINKAHWYLHWTSGGWATQVDSSISSKLVKVFGTIFLIMIIYLVFKKPRNNNQDEHVNNNKSLYKEPMISFLFLTAVFALGCLHIKTGAFWRFESIVVLFSPVVLIQAIDNKVISKKFFYIMCAYASMLVIYNILYQISNTNATQTMINFTTTPGVKILYEIGKGVIHLGG